MESRKDRIRRFLHAIETGETEAVAVVDESKYIQHNPLTKEGNEGLAELFTRLAKTNPRVRVVRAFEDGDFVFAHTEYDFSSVKIAFEVFRFEGDRAVEHWDNLQPVAGPNPSGRGMLDGPTEVDDHGRTEANRALVRTFVEDVLIGRNVSSLASYVDEGVLQHSPTMSDGRDALRASLEALGDRLDVQRIHRVLAEGNFVLSVSEGVLDGTHSSFYDLFRIDGAKIVEHWDTIEEVPSRSLWNNDNGKF